MNIFDDTAYINLTSNTFSMSELAEQRISENIVDITRVFF